MGNLSAPESWAITTIESICEIVRGVTFKKADSIKQEADGYIPVLRANAIQNGHLIFSNLVFVPSEMVSERQLIRKHDIVIAMSSGSKMLVGKAAQSDKDYSAGFGAFCGILRPNLLIDARYFGHFFQSKEYRNRVSMLSAGVNINNLKPAHFKLIDIPLSPLPEQTRIANKLDELLDQVNTIKARVDAIPAIMKHFRQSVLASAVSGRLTEGWRGRNHCTTEEMLSGFIPPPKPPRYKTRNMSLIPGVIATAVGKPETKIVSQWDWTPLVQIARMESGHTPSRSKPEYWNGDICWIGIKDARESHASTIRDTEQKTNDLGLANSASRLLPVNTVCISRTASVGYVVKMGKPMATSQDFVNWVPTEVLDPDWLKWLFVAEKESLFRFGKGSTHTTVYFPEWLSMHIALPPIQEQIEIVRRIESLFTFADQIEQRVADAQARINQLTQSILAKAFRGELVPQDPNDEPASVLLERIREEREAAAKLLKVLKKRRKPA